MLFKLLNGLSKPGMLNNNNSHYKKERFSSESLSFLLPTNQTQANQLITSKPEATVEEFDKEDNL